MLLVMLFSWFWRTRLLLFINHSLRQGSCSTGRVTPFDDQVSVLRVSLQLNFFLVDTAPHALLTRRCLVLCLLLDLQIGQLGVVHEHCVDSLVLLLLVNRHCLLLRVVL